MYFKISSGENKCGASIVYLGLSNVSFFCLLYSRFLMKLDLSRLNMPNCLNVFKSVGKNKIMALVVCGLKNFVQS